MAELKINIPNPVLGRVLDGVAITKRYTDNKINGETKADFAKRMVTNEIKTWVRDAETLVAVQTAIDGIKNSIELDLNLT